MTAAETSHDAVNHQSSTLQGAQFDLEALALDDAARAEVLEKAFDFRGDVTLVLSDGRTVTGYIFDRSPASSASEAGSAATAQAHRDRFVRLLPADSNQRMTVRFGDIRKLEFGKDAAHGKTWENWVKRYVEKKMKGEAASIEAETLG